MGIKLSLKTVNLMIFIPFDKWVQIINSLQRFKSLISKLRIFEKLCVAAQAKIPIAIGMRQRMYH
jgi:hypothetical protein